jgi:hypothetical protein
VFWEVDQKAAGCWAGEANTKLLARLSKWHEYLGDSTAADAILDRLLHNAHRIVLKKGPSLRKEEVPLPVDNHQRRCAPITMPLNEPITMRRND